MMASNETHYGSFPLLLLEINKNSTAVYADNSECNSVNLSVNAQEEPDWDVQALDWSIAAVLKNRELKGDAKWIQYYRALEIYLYKKDPSFKPSQFDFDISEDVNGARVYTLKQQKTLLNKFKKCLPNLVISLAGISLSALLRAL